MFTDAPSGQAAWPLALKATVPEMNCHRRWAGPPAPTLRSRSVAPSDTGEGNVFGDRVSSSQTVRPSRRSRAVAVSVAVSVNVSRVGGRAWTS